jgi:hypothetical protein
MTNYLSETTAMSPKDPTKQRQHTNLKTVFCAVSALAVSVPAISNAQETSFKMETIDGKGEILVENTKNKEMDARLIAMAGETLKHLRSTVTSGGKYWENLLTAEVNVRAMDVVGQDRVVETLRPADKERIDAAKNLVEQKIGDLAELKNGARYGTVTATFLHGMTADATPKPTTPTNNKRNGLNL